METCITAPISTEAPKLLSQQKLDDLNTRIATNADKWLGLQALKNKMKSAAPEQQLKSASGRKPNIVENPFCGYIGHDTCWGRYPAFAIGIIEGIARLDWHDRSIDTDGRSMPLSVRNLVKILEHLPVVSNATVEVYLRLGERHARRYVKAIKAIVPQMMKYCPKTLRNEMAGIEPEPQPCKWDDRDELVSPSPEELAKLHHDLRTFTEYKTAEEYEAEYEAELSGSSTSNVIAFPARKQHPKKAQALTLLEQGMGVRAIARELEVSVNSVRSWKDSFRIDQLAA